MSGGGKTATSAAGASALPVYVEAYPVPLGPSPHAFGTAPVVSEPVHAVPGGAPFNEDGIRQYLTENQWPRGLQDTFIRNLSRIPIRFFICDDSGSMSTSDGKRLVPVGHGQKKIVSCSRWSELTTALGFHAQLARIAGAVSEFRFLNGAAPITIGDGHDDDGGRFQCLQAVMENSPSGGTPLCHHIREVIEKIRLLAPGLRAAGQKAVVVIATDGESSDGDVAQALRPLKELPAWVVIRLCTDEERIVNYWNNIDNELELDMDVLDDLGGEAAEVTEKNPWLTYGEPMHRLREFGIPVKEIDLLDEAELSLEQIRTFCALLLGGTVNSYPHPDVDWNGFKRAIERGLQSIPQTYCPIRKVMRPWLSTHKIFAKKDGVCSIS